VAIEEAINIPGRTVNLISFYFRGKPDLKELSEFLLERNLNRICAILQYDRSVHPLSYVKKIVERRKRK
jgi:hypothetical protein